MNKTSPTIIDPKQLALSKADQQLSIANNALAIIDRNRYIDFFATHPEICVHFQNSVLSEYPLSDVFCIQYCRELPDNDFLEEQLLRIIQNINIQRSVVLLDFIILRLNEIEYSEDLSYLLIDDTEIIDYPWTEYSLDQFKDQLNWYELSWNQSLPWTDELINRYSELWEWRGISCIRNIPWTTELIIKHIDRWEWGDGSYDIEYSGLSGNQHLPWSVLLIETFKDRWDWYLLSINPSLPWDIDLIRRFADHWDWYALTTNEALPWNESLIEICIPKAIQERPPEYQYAVWNTLARNTSLPWNESLIERYKDKWDWGILSNNSALPWSEAFIEKYKNKWRWKYHFHMECISANTSLPWSEALIERYRDKWQWEYLSSNTSLPWSESLIERYRDKWDWATLSSNISLPWSELLIDRFADSWEWGHVPKKRNPWNYKPEPVQGLSGNESLPWCVNLIDKYIKRWEWMQLTNNIAVQWNEHLIERYETKLNFGVFDSEAWAAMISQWDENSIRSVFDMKLELDRCNALRELTRKFDLPIGNDYPAEWVSEIACADIAARALTIYEDDRDDLAPRTKIILIELILHSANELISISGEDANYMEILGNMVVNEYDEYKNLFSRWAYPDPSNSEINYPISETLKSKIEKLKN